MTRAEHRSYGTELYARAAPEQEGQEAFGGRYRPIRLLKKGHGVETTLALDVTLGDTVVIKTASTESLTKGAQMRLEHEAGVLRQIRSSFCAPLLQLGHEGDLVYLVIPFIPGITLERRLSLRALSVRETITVGRCLMTVLHEVHDNGVLHRDLKPANIIVEDEIPLQKATVIDFGLARSAQLDAAIRDQPVGTARYMSPEQAGLLDHEVDERSDLYSAGVLLFECLAGRPPFQGDSVGEVLRQHMTVRPPELRSLGLAVPRVLDEVIQRLLAKDPRDRYQSAEAVSADLTFLADALDRGIADPALVVGLRDRRRTLTEPAFVGRAGELTALDAQLDKARGGRGGLVFLEAESGGGKTRLLAELAQRSRLRGAWVLVGHGLDQAAQRPFQVLVGVARELLGAARADKSLAATLRNALGDHREAACAALPELTEILGSRTAEVLGPESFGQTRSLQALAHLLDGLGSREQPALVILDDCQWADELSLKLIAHWQRQRDADKDQDHHVVLVAAFRSDEVPQGHPLRRLQPAAHITLAPFGPEDVKRLAESMAGQLPEKAIAVVERLSEGSPFMTVAVLRGLVESGALVAEPSGWRVEPLALANIHSSGHAAAFLARRIELLPEASLQLLSVGSVLGKEFDIDFAATLVNQGGPEAIAAIDEARRRHMIWVQPQGTRCVFIHDKLRRALLDRLGADERKQLHRRAALYLEKQDANRVFELAYHFDAAGEFDRALPHALAAAEQARSQHSLEIAEQQYRIAQRGSQATDKTTRYRIAEGLGDILMLQGRYDEAAQEFEAARALVEGAVAPAQIEGKLGELAFKRGEVKNASESIERALRLLGKRVPRTFLGFLILVLWEMLVQVLHTLIPPLFLARRGLENAGFELIAIRLYSRLAYVYWFGRGKVPVLWAHLREMNLAERYPPSPELAQAYSSHAPAMTLFPLFRRGIAYAEKSLAIRKALGDLWGQGQSLHFYGVVLYGASRFEEGIQRCREAVRLLERTGDHWEVNIARFQIAACLYRLGDLRGAVEEAQRIHRSGLELGDIQSSGISLDIWARASGGKVPAEMVRTELQRVRTDLMITAEIMLADGVRLLGEERENEAAEVFEQAHQLTEKVGIRNIYVSPILPWLATALRLEAQKLRDYTPKRRQALLRRAEEAARKGLRVARRFRNELPHALRETAVLAAMRGRATHARRRFEESLAAAQEQAARYEHAQTLLARGLVGLEFDWPGAAEDVVKGQQAMRFVESMVPGRERTSGTEAGKLATLSLADRFDNVLDAGRHLASALSREAVFASVREAALRLLRGDRCLVVDVGRNQEAEDITTVSGEIEAQFSRTMVRRAVEIGRAIAFVEGMPDNTSESVLLSGVRSVLCAPIFVRGRPTACFYVTHRHVAGLFGQDEHRLADFIAAIAGAALENAAGFAELRQLNEILELRINEQRQAEKQIQEQAALLNKASDAILVQDLEDRILFWSHGAERLYGWTAEEAVGKDGKALLNKELSPAMEEARQAVLARGDWTGELCQNTRNGKAIMVVSRWTLVRDEEGRPKSKLIINTDVTEKKALEAQYLRVQRMESIGTLAGGIAHDLNNVLTPIMMGVEFLKLPLPEDERQTMLATLQTSAERGAEMVKQILSFARGAEGQRVILQLKHIIREIEKVLRHTLPKSIEMRTSLPKELWVISGDATQLYQVLMNLCVNARDAMPQGGRLTISAENKKVSEKDARMNLDARPGFFVLLRVADTGTGIPADILEKIFDPFFTTKEIGKGTGLGLSTVLGIVRSHGGFIQLSSEVGAGTQFSVYLPVAETADLEQEQEEHSHLSSGKGELILVVDDEPAIREITKATLQSNGYRVLTAKDGADALVRYAEHRGEVKLVLTDMMMPLMDGPTTIRAIKNLDPGVPIIAVSGLGGSLSASSRTNLPTLQGRLTKPYTSEELLDILGRVLQGK